MSAGTESSSIAAPFMGAWVNAREHGASGSEFQTVGAIRAGSNEIALQEVGDFQVGQEVAVYGCCLQYNGTVYGAGSPYIARNRVDLHDEIELRGLNSGKEWKTFLIHFDATDPVTFRWMAVDPLYQTRRCTHPVFRRDWCWQGESLPVGADWVPLTDGVQMRFRKRDWQPGQSIGFHARNRLLARITKIHGRTLTLSAPATDSIAEAVVRHHDQFALQSALEHAIAEQKGLFIPAGRYRLSEGLRIENASIRVEGTHRDQVTLDVSEAHAAVFWISGGKDVVIRNLGMVGHTGFLELPPASFQTATGFAFWPATDMRIKGCQGARIQNTEHLLFEDLKVSRMAAEALYSQGSDRYGPNRSGPPGPPGQYTKSCIYHRCLVRDCAFNAFNNNDHAENTSILHCHVERVANFCENASRFTRIIGNYVLDGCATSVHAGSADDPHKVGTTQAVIADNVFEGGTFSGGISIGNHATQVVVTNNLFVGFSKEVAIHVGGGRRIIITGNHIDLTRIESNPDNERCGISIEGSNVQVADNHIYVRGERSAKVTGMHVADDAVNIQVHDNLIENCHCGFRTGRRVYVPQEGQGHFEFVHTESEVEQALGPGTFRDKALPLRCDDGAPYRGWFLRWLSGPLSGETSTIRDYEPKDRTVTLKEPVTVQAGVRFTVHPRQANWQVHHNTFSECAVPMLVDLSKKDGVQIERNVTSF